MQALVEHQALTPSDLEPVSGFEPLTCRLQEARPGARGARPARIPQSRVPDDPDRTVCTDNSVHEPVHDHHSKRLTGTTKRYSTPRDIRIRYARAERLVDRRTDRDDLYLGLARVPPLEAVIAVLHRDGRGLPGKSYRSNCARSDSASQAVYSGSGQPRSVTNDR